MKNNRLLALLLSLAMVVTMLPAMAFAEEDQQNSGAGPQILVDNDDPSDGNAIYGTGEPDDATSEGGETTVVEGTKENPFVMTYWRNQYYCDCWIDSEFEQKEIWVKLVTRSEAMLAFEAFTFADDDLLRSATMYDSDQKTVIYKFDFNEERNAYETEKLQLKKQTYYFKLKLSEIPYEQGYSVNSMVDEATKPAGTFEDPIIVKADMNTADDEYEDYYTDEHFYLDANTQSVYYRLDAFKTEYYNLNIATYNEVGIKSIKLLDADRKEIAEFEHYFFEGDNLLPEDYVNYSLDNFQLEKDKRYYIEVLLDKSVQYDPLELNVMRLDGNGLQENPFIINYLPSDYSEWYYGYGSIYKNQPNKEYWFKATIDKDAKIKAYAGAGYDFNEEIIDKAVLYLPGDTTGINLVKNEYDALNTSEYYPVKKGDIVLLKLVLNEKAKAGEGLYAQLDCFGLTDWDVTIELNRDQYTYDGKVHKPVLAYIKYKDIDLIPGVDYEEKLVYSNTKNIGYNEVQVVGKGDYQGSRFLYFAINPKGTKLTTLKPWTRSITVNWKKQAAKMSVDRITGYEIQYSTSKKFNNSTTKTATVKGYKNTYKTIKKLKKGKKYYVRIRTYYYDDFAGDYVYSKWSASKSVKLK